MKRLNYFYFVLFILLFASCKDDDNSVNNTISYPEKAVLNKRDVIANLGSGVSVYNGGFGSSIASNEPGVFYALTDRGPNIDGVNSNEKVFSNPNFVPQIAKFKLSGDSLKFEKIILLKDETGKNLSGLPNPQGIGGTGEKPINLNGNVLNYDEKGIDPEGLAIAKDGTFWISDEYGPHIIHFDANGNTIERINPFGNGLGGRKIPPVYKYRRPNRGMEGLTLTKDENYLVGMMQSPLLNPDKSVQKTSKTVRILFYDIKSGAAKEYIYILESTSTAVSEIVALTNNTFLVLERDGNTPGADQNNFKKIYKIDVTNATNVTTNDENGKMINGKTIEQLTVDELIASGITPVKKEEVFDIMSIPNYPHDKPEGVVVINSKTIAIINDDDFGVQGTGTYQQKLMPLLGNKPDMNILYFVKLTKDLY